MTNDLDGSDVRALFVRLRRPEDRPLMTDEESETWAPVDPDYDAAIRDHLAPELGDSSGGDYDTSCMTPIDVAQTEPGDGRPWGALYTVGAGAWVAADRPRVELILRVPETAFRYWNGVVLEPFDDATHRVVDVLGELARLPLSEGARFDPPQIVATPDLRPFADDFSFAGALLRDGATARFGAKRGGRGAPPIEVSRFGLVTFMTVAFLHASELRALLGPGRRAAAKRLETAGVDDLLDLRRRPAI